MKEKLTSAVVYADVVYGAVKVFAGAEGFDETGFVGFGGVGWMQEGRVDGALALPGLYGVCEPVGVVDGEPRDCEEEHDREAHHGEIDVQPARAPWRSFAVRLVCPALGGAA